MRRHHDEKVQRLRAVPAFGRLPARELRAIAAAGDLVELEPGRVVQEAGHRPRGGVLVLDGTIVAAGSSFGPGSFVGRDEVLRGDAAVADAVTATPVLGLVFHTPELRSLFAERRSAA